MRVSETQAEQLIDMQYDRGTKAVVTGLIEALKGRVEVVMEDQKTNRREEPNWEQEGEVFKLGEEIKALQSILDKLHDHY
jgi:hypothetical protein